MENRFSPITPPLQLLKHWEEQHFDEGENYDVMLIQAYQAGANQELEACCEYISRWFATPEYRAAELRAARRPKPPSLKELALETFNKLEHLFDGYGNDGPTIRRALESLPD